MVLKPLLLASISLFLSCNIVKNTSNTSLSSDFQTLLDASIDDKMSGILVHIESPKDHISWSGAAGVLDIKTQAKLYNRSIPELVSIKNVPIRHAFHQVVGEGLLLFLLKSAHRNFSYDR